MTELPDGWIWTTIGDVCEKPKYGWTTSASDIGEVKLLRTTDLTHGPITWETVPFCKETPKTVADFEVHPNDIFISRAGSVGVSVLVKDAPFKSVFASYLIRVRPTKRIDARYLSLFLQSPHYWNQVVELSSGIALANINATKIQSMTLPLPPIGEQHKIVELLEDHLSRLDAALTDVKQAKIKAAQFRQSLLNSVFYGNKFESFDLGTCIELIMGQAPPGITCNKNGDGTPFVKVGEFAKLYPTIEEWTLKPLRLAKKGDVLICVVGATVGKINLGIDCAIGRSVAAIRPKNKLLQKYLYYFLELKMLEIRGQSKGSAQGVITKDYINSIQIPLPELKVQQDILDLLESNFSQIEKSIDVSNVIERESLSLRRSLLQAAFTGQLTKEVASV
jgi:type I restriction enzyme S subunit